MKSEEFNDIISQARHSIERDRAIAGVLSAEADEKCKLLEYMKALFQENQELREQQKVMHVTNQIEHFEGNYIEHIQKAELCQPSSTTSTELTSNTSIPTSNINIRPLRRE